MRRHAVTTLRRRPRLVVVALLVLAIAGCSSSTPGRVAPTPTSAPTSPRPAHRTHPSPVASTPTPVVAAKVVDACAANRAPKQVRVDISRQRVWFCERGRSVFTGAVTTGMSGRDTATPTGNFHIQGRNRDTVLTLSSGRQYDVRYWIPFDAPLYGFHDSSWQRFAYGSPRYRTDGSHGCVHLPLGTIARLYRWAPIGTPVHIGA